MDSMKNKLKLIDWIGKEIEVIDSRNRDYIGIKGKVIDETKNLLVIDTGKGIKKILKEGTKFKVEGKVMKGIKARPWEVKKRWKSD